MSKRKLKTSIKRLTKLRDVMATAKPIPHSKAGHTIDVGGGRILFDIDYWAAEAIKSSFYPDLACARENGGADRLEDPIQQHHSCGTACCLAGTAGFIPEFRRAGYRTDAKAGHITLHGSPPEDREVSTSAALFAEFFGCSYTDASHLVDPSEYDVYPVTPEAVVGRLDVVIERQKAKLEVVDE